MKILFLGGSGILSLDVLKECLKRGYDITCITRGNRDHRFPEGIRIIHGNVWKLEEILPKLESDYDAILDFLSFKVDQLKYKLDCLASKCNQYFFVSSSVAYSFRDEIITESTPLGNEFWDYGSDKEKCEAFLKAHYKDYGITYTIIRPYITYGKTRIPFGIIPVSGEYWTLANRILHNKPILLWDNGTAKCTLTNTEDFAKAYADLIGNPKSRNEAFHITSDEVLTWAEVLEYVGKELHCKPVVFSESTDEIVKILPEYSGVLQGDKARDRIFDNSKIKDAAPSFRGMKPFSVGIAETIQNYRDNPIERTMNYEWDGRIDRAIIRLAKKANKKMDLSALKYTPAEGKGKFADWYAYSCGRYSILSKINNCVKKIGRIPHKCKEILKKTIGEFKKKLHRKAPKDGETLMEGKFHSIGVGCVFDNVDFGKDTKLITIGNNVRICSGTKFINYRPSVEHFDRIFSGGENPMLRDLGPIQIEDNIFIGTNVILFPNTTIGKNSLILDGSVITEPIPPNSVVCGNPAKVIANTDSWYQVIMGRNKEYPWYGKNISHDEIVKERESFFFGR